VGKSIGNAEEGAREREKGGFAGKHKKKKKKNGQPKCPRPEKEIRGDSRQTGDEGKKLRRVSELGVNRKGQSICMSHKQEVAPRTNEGQNRRSRVTKEE